MFIFGGSFSLLAGVYKNKNPYTFQPFGEGHATLARTLAVPGEGIEDTYPHSLGGGPLASLVLSARFIFFF